MKQKLRIAFLMGADTESARLCIEKVCGLANVEVVAALLDEERTGLRRRVKNLRRNVRKEGWPYIPHRVVKFLRGLTDRLVERSVVSPDAVHQVLTASFPDRCFSLRELSQKYNFEVLEVGNLNESRAVAAFKAADTDLGIVLGTRILKEQIFSVPRLGCINLHKGMVPNYRGMPPAFWELYDGAASAGVTVHLVNKGLDTGDVLATSEIPILPTDTPDTLCEKLHEEGARTLATAVDAIAAGTAVSRKQGRPDLKARSAPTVGEVRELRKRLPHWRHRGDAPAIAVNMYLLLVYWSGLYFLMRMWHQRLRARGCILLYHRVNDYSKDILTVDTATFAAQLMVMRERYPSTSTKEMVNRIRLGEKLTPTSIAIHFDDCYRDTVLNGMPILSTLGYTPTSFISSGFLNSDRAFPHDSDNYPFRFPNQRTDDLRAWCRAGFEIGAHTVNHVDLGTCTIEEAKYEVTESRLQLDAVLTANGILHSQPAEQSVRFMSYPFGQPQNIRSEVVAIVRDVGYSALFSAYGGSARQKTDLFNIPRMGVSGETRPLYLLLEIEGLAPRQVFRRLGVLR
jgi:folate-dependent phosphoribosylglycinamide formyltransferase PurN/peptidoglycan/xylan/chitin deacetylase (PgdA/CDA1 family)